MATETDALWNAKKGESLAEIMLRNGATLAGPAPRTAEQVVTAAEVIEEAETVTAEAAQDVAVIEVEVGVCANFQCLNAAHDTCECSCGGHGHGAATQIRATATRARTQARIDRSGGIEALLRTMGGLAPADEPF